MASLVWPRLSMRQRLERTIAKIGGFSQDQLHGYQYVEIEIVAEYLKILTRVIGEARDFRQAREHHSHSPNVLPE